MGLLIAYLFTAIYSVFYFMKQRFARLAAPSRVGPTRGSGPAHASRVHPAPCAVPCEMCRDLSRDTRAGVQSPRDPPRARRLAGTVASGTLAREKTWRVISPCRARAGLAPPCPPVRRQDLLEPPHGKSARGRRAEKSLTRAPHPTLEEGCDALRLEGAPSPSRLPLRG